MAEIVPAILEKSKQEFLDKVSKVLKLPGLQRIQVDFGDGVFVPNTMLPVTEIDPLNPAFSWEAHLMIKEPKDFLDYKIAGFRTIIVHYEAYPSAGGLLSAIGEIKSLGLEPGVCLNHETPITVLEDLKKEVRHFQLMGITPGFQGSPFFEDTYGRIAELRKLASGAVIEIDGGVRLENINKLAQAGADLIIAGSALVKAQNVMEIYEKLSSEINKN